MSMKSWVLHRVAGRSDLPPHDARRQREPDLDLDAAAERTDPGAAPDALRAGADLGVYAPLIGAVRDELEHFVASHVRLHVVIAERDRFMLTSIGVRSPGGAEARDLLRQFMHEFRPEQVKRYLAREVIGRLPNAAVIDLSQFAGLADLETSERPGDEGEYRELLEALRTTPARPVARPYEIGVIGRWSEADAAGAAPSRRHDVATPTTPLAGRRVEFDIDDGAGPRRAVLPAVVPGRRYVVGKDESSDLRVDGTYTSRRHAELWLDDDGWHVADAGSTNGLRVESGGADGTPARTVATATASDAAPIKVGAGMRIVLSARAEGPPADYPSIAVRTPRHAASTATPATPIAAAAAAPKTPLTSVLAARNGAARFAITATQAGGEARHAIAADALPLTIGRSRDQAIVIDRRHPGVSGHHVAIDAVDDDGAHGVVLGDNGIAVDGVAHGPGERFDWRAGQTMVLGGALPDEPACTLVLDRDGGER